MRKELIELRNYCLNEKEKAKTMFDANPEADISVQSFYIAEFGAFSDITLRLDLILKNSVVKPLDERSPTDEQNQADVSRPNDEAKSE